MKDYSASAARRWNSLRRRVFPPSPTIEETLVEPERIVSSFGEVFYGGLFPYNIAPLGMAPPAEGRGGKVTLFLPSLGTAAFFGGAATALIVAGKLALRLDKGLRIVESSHGSGDPSALSGFFSELEMPIKGEDVELVNIATRRYNQPGSLDIHPDDDFVASAWWDAYVLNTLALPRKYVYLIQDYEPIFYANSDRYVLADGTYRSSSFVPLCNTKLMRDFLAERYPYIEREARWFEPAASHRPYGVCRPPEGKKTIFLYGRPSVERNLFFCALHALEAVFASKRLDPDQWRVVMAGQDDLPDVALSCGVIVENLGKLAIDDYRKLTLEVDLAISLMMAPHPNYPTLELASVGAAVVTTRYANKQDLSHYSKNIVMSDLTHNSIATAIAEAAEISYETRIENARLASIPSNWETTLAPSLDDITLLLRS